MTQLEGFDDQSKPDYVCKLKKALYRLKQALRAWYDKLKLALLQWGFLNSKFDTSLFYCKQGGKVLLVLIYVVDILIIGLDQHQVTKLIADLNK